MFCQIAPNSMSCPPEHSGGHISIQDHISIITHWSAVSLSFDEEKHSTDFIFLCHSPVLPRAPWNVQGCRHCVPGDVLAATAAPHQAPIVGTKAYKSSLVLYPCMDPIYDLNILNHLYFLLVCCFFLIAQYWNTPLHCNPHLPRWCFHLSSSK